MTEMSNPEKPTETWVTGDEPLTGPQASYLATLAREAGEDVPDGLTKAQASEMIDRLQQQTGRGSDEEGSSIDPGQLRMDGTTSTDGETALSIDDLEQQQQSS